MNFGDTERARAELAQAMASRRPDAIARAVHANIWPLYTTHPELLTAAVVELPGVQLDRSPLLRILHPMTPVRARMVRLSSTNGWTADPRTMSPEDILFQTFAQMVVFRYAGDMTAALGSARRLEERLLQAPVDVRGRLDGPLWFFHHQIGTTLLAAGDTGAALVEFATARQIGALSPHPFAERMALGRTALAHAMRGSLVDAEHALEEARTMPPVTTTHAGASLASEAAAAALIAVERLSDDIDDALRVASYCDGIELNWAFTLLATSRAYLARARPEDALEAIQFASSTHPPQQGSFGADVIAAMSIEALIAVGDTASAWRLAQGGSDGGVLGRLASTHLLLHDGRFDEAAAALRSLVGHPALGPAQRAETVIYSGWVEIGRSGELEPDTAEQILRIARRPDRRRLLSIVPRQLVEHVKRSLQHETAIELDAVSSGLANVVLQARPALTTGELRVLRALPAQRSTAMMASTFHVSPNTVKSQLRSLYRKLGCSTREDAVRVATRLRLLAAVAND